jgi:hypothetical protein
MNVEGHSAQGVVQVRWLGWKHGILYIKVDEKISS